MTGEEVVGFCIICPNRRVETGYTTTDPSSCPRPRRFHQSDQTHRRGDPTDVSCRLKTDPMRERLGDHTVLSLLSSRLRILPDTGRQCLAGKTTDNYQIRLVSPAGQSSSTFSEMEKKKEIYNNFISLKGRGGKFL